MPIAFTRALAFGALVGGYEGRRYSARQLSRRRWNDRLTYLFSLSNGETIDGAEGGNATRHINHSCVPNCEAVEEHDAKGRLVLKIYTSTSVEAGAEAFLNYRLIADEAFGASDYPCFCLSATCRGTLIGLS
jgi:SET domain-containing protein